MRNLKDLLPGDTFHFTSDPRQVEYVVVANVAMQEENSVLYRVSDDEINHKRFTFGHEGVQPTYGNRVECGCECCRRHQKECMC